MLPTRKPIYAGVALAGGIALATTLLVSPQLRAAAPTRNSAPNANAPLTEDEKILHVLNRLGFGARPGDVQMVRERGLDRYIQDQLHPESIDDSAVDQKLSFFTALQMNGDDLARIFYQRQSAGRAVQVMRKDVLKEDPADANPAMANQNAAQNPAMAGAGAGPGLPPDAAKGAELMAAATPEQREQIRQLRQNLATRAQAVARVDIQLATSKLVRAVESKRQLQEVMVDFWSNHFNIDTRKQQCSTLKAADDRDVIRPNALGKFRDLLGASAKSPAMLVYLDNFQSTSPHLPDPSTLGPVARRRLAALRAAGQQIPGNKKNPGGLNENYGREIMELHTLGVDGGYTQKDVTEVARCFTGWGVSRLPDNDPQYPNRKFIPGGSFEFHPYLHDEGEKVVLGQVIPAGGGVNDGEKVLDILARSPQTMHHVSYELCQRLVSDTPPDSLVNKCVDTWKRTDGDIREIVQTIVTSPEFFSRTAFEKKIKSPYEYGVSSVRALGGVYDLDGSTIGTGRQRVKKDGLGLYNDQTLAGQISTMGEPLFQYQAPTGYPEDSHKWVSSGALISRLNFSLALANGKLIEIGLPNRADAAQLTGPEQLVDRIGQQILHGEMSPSTRDTLLRQASEAPDAQSAAASVDLNTRLTALILGSPEFQRR